MITASPELKISNVNLTPAAVSLELGDVVQEAHRAQLDLEKKLTKDRTKTKSAKALFAAEAASKRIEQIWNKADKKAAEINGDLYKYNKRIESQMKLNGTTDMLLLQNYGQLIQNMNVSEITELGREGDMDALRACLLLPALKFQEKFRNAQDLFTNELRRVVLGDDYQSYEQLNEQKSQAEQLEAGIVKTLDSYKKEIKRIKSTVVAPDEMPEVG